MKARPTINPAHERLWALVAEPKTVTVLMGVVYAATVVAGYYALWDVPAAVEDSIGETLSIVWGATLVIAGVVGLVGCIPGWYWLERAGTIGGALAILAYALALYGQDAAYPLRNFTTQSAVAFALCMFFMIRLARIWGLTVDPARKPSRLVRRRLDG